MKSRWSGGTSPWFWAMSQASLPPFPRPGVPFSPSSTTQARSSEVGPSLPWRSSPRGTLVPPPPPRGPLRLSPATAAWPSPRGHERPYVHWQIPASGFPRPGSRSRGHSTRWSTEDLPSSIEPPTTRESPLHSASLRALTPSGTPSGALWVCTLGVPWIG